MQDELKEDKQKIIYDLPRLSEKNVPTYRAAGQLLSFKRPLLSVDGSAYLQL